MFIRSTLTAFVLSLSVAAAATPASTAAPSATATTATTTVGAWEVVSQNERVVVKARSHPGRPIKEVLAEGIIDAPAWVLKNVVDDVERYPELIPFTTVARIVGRDGGDRVAFQRLEMPLLQKREYVVRVFDDSHVGDDGRHVYKMGWTNADERFASAIAADAVRTPVNDGSWTFEELKDGRTFATFHLFVDPSGALPPVVVNFAQQVTLGLYLANLERLAGDPRYRLRPQMLAVAAR